MRSRFPSPRPGKPRTASATKKDAHNRGHHSRELVGEEESTTPPLLLLKKKGPVREKSARAETKGFMKTATSN